MKKGKKSFLARKAKFVRYFYLSAAIFAQCKQDFQSVTATTQFQ